MNDHSYDSEELDFVSRPIVGSAGLQVVCDQWRGNDRLSQKYFILFGFGDWCDDTALLMFYHDTRVLP